MYYEQLHFKYLCNLATYWLQAPWGWHDSVEICRSVIICEIIANLLVIAHNIQRCTVHVLNNTYANLFCIIICWYSSGAQTSQKSSSHLKILSARRATWSMVHTEDPQILGAIVQYLVAIRPGDRDLYTAVVACPANTLILKIIFFSYSIRYTTDLHHHT